MKKILIAFICLCLVTASLAGCATKTEKREKNILKELKGDRVEVDYVTVFNSNASDTNVGGSYKLIDNNDYLCTSGNSVYTKKYVGTGGVEYEIYRTNLGGTNVEVVCSLPFSDEFFEIIMINPDCYYRYKVVGIYDDPAHALLEWPTAYEYQWYKFYTDGATEPEGPISKYTYRDEIYGNDRQEMIDNFRNSRILSHLGRRSDKFVEADGIMSTLTSMTVENDHDTFEFTKICGYNSECKTLLFHCFYRVSEGNKLIGGPAPQRLELIFLLDESGEIHYVGEYGDFMNNDVKYIVPIN